jgi:chemotaxis signal transduction protein
MKNEEILKTIESNDSGSKDGSDQVAEKIIKLLVFHVKERKFAIYADQIREIVMDTPLFFVPFVPAYIRGFINRHGEPYTVFDLNALIEKEKLEGETYLIMNVENDHFAFLITGIVEILKIPERGIHLITSKDEHDGFFAGSFTGKDGEVFILNLTSVLERLENDLESA